MRGSARMLEQAEGLGSVAPPEARGELLATSAARSSRRGSISAAWWKNSSRTPRRRLAVPARVADTGADAEATRRRAQISSPTLRQSVSLPPKMLTWRVASSDLDDVLARELHPVVAARRLRADADRERAHAAALGDDVAPP